MAEWEKKALKGFDLSTLVVDTSQVLVSTIYLAYSVYTLEYQLVVNSVAQIRSKRFIPMGKLDELQGHIIFYEGQPQSPVTSDVQRKPVNVCLFVCLFIEAPPTTQGHQWM